jgi:hypothetical protein
MVEQGQAGQCVFEGARLSIDALVSWIKDEAKLWASAGSTGLRVESCRPGTCTKQNLLQVCNTRFLGSLLQTLSFQ